MNTQKETEWDRVAHSKTQTHVRTQTEPVELGLMWPGAAQRPATTHTHTHLRAICSWRYSLQKGFTADTLRQTEREGQERREKLSWPSESGDYEEAKPGRVEGREKLTDRKVKGKLWPQTLSLTFSPLKHKTASPTLSLRFQQLLNASPYWMKFPLGAFCSGPKDFMPLHNQIITNNDKSQNSGSLGVCSDKVPFVK